MFVELIPTALGDATMAESFDRSVLPKMLVVSISIIEAATPRDLILLGESSSK